MTVSQCIATNDSSGVQLTIFGGSDCGSVDAIGCVVCSPKSVPSAIKTDTLTVFTLPCKQYWIQLDGYAEAVCNFTLTYDPKQLLKDVAAPIITGEKSVCIGTTQTYCASLPNGCKPSSWIWGTSPAGKAIFTSNAKDSCIDVKWTSTGTFKLTAKPKFNIKCPPQTIATASYDVTIYDLKISKCNITLCCEDVPYDFPLLPCIKTANPTLVGTADPVDYTISSGCNGGTTTKLIPYEMSPSGCLGKVELTLTVKNKSIPMVLTSKILNSTGKNGAINLTVTNGKMPTFLWSNGATIEDILNLAPGKYCVTVTDTESCSQTECFEVKDLTSSEETETSRAISIFPNPVNDVLFIKIENNIILTKIELLDTKGSVLSIFSGETRQINMNNLPSAVYFLKCYTKDDFVVKRIVR